MMFSTGFPHLKSRRASYERVRGGEVGSGEKWLDPNHLSVPNLGIKRRHINQMIQLICGGTRLCDG